MRGPWMYPRRWRGARGSGGRWRASRSSRGRIPGRACITGLSATVSFASRLLREGQVRDLAERWFGALEALVRHVQQDAAAGGRTPSDLALVELTQSELEELESRYRPIEDIMPLSPLQEGLLFHALYDARGPDVYTVQLELELDGALDGAVLQASVEAVVNRHASLRAAFRHERLDR